jgi:hypothetical protein
MQRSHHLCHWRSQRRCVYAYDDGRIRRVHAHAEGTGAYCSARLDIQLRVSFLARTRTLTHAHTLTRTHTLTHSHTLSLTLSLSHTHSHTQIRTHSRTQIHTHFSLTAWHSRSATLWFGSIPLIRITSSHTTCRALPNIIVVAPLVVPTDFLCIAGVLRKRPGDPEKRGLVQASDSL